MATRILRIEGLHCEGCETIVETAVAKLPGVTAAKANYNDGLLRVEFDRSKVGYPDIAAAVEQEGYACSLQPRRSSSALVLGRLLTIAVALVVIVALLAVGQRLADRLALPQLERGMGYGLLFMVGFLTGFHCVGMCGGFVLGYTARLAATRDSRRLLPHLAYGLGKTLSYTLIGGAFGFLGSFIAFTPELRGYAAVVAGIFLVLFGINMLDWFPSLHHIGVKMPRGLRRFVGRETRRSHGPFVIGLLNGLMIACGPLQAMYIMAAGTGEFLEGAKLMFVFGLGTLPIMLGFGAITGLVSGRLTHGLLKVSAFLVVTLGLIMLDRGLTLTGSSYDFRSLGERVVLLQQQALAVAQEWQPAEPWRRYWLPLKARLGRVAAANRGVAEPGTQVVQTIRMVVDGQGYHPDQFTVRAGVPVRWLIEGKEITRCNQHLLIPALGLDIELHPGLNIVEFTPKAAGTLPFSCWMGMLRGSFRVEAGSKPGAGASSDP